MFSGNTSGNFKSPQISLKLLTRLVGNKSRKLKKTEREKKQLVHVRNFDPTRLKNRSWQIRSGKKLTKKQKKHYKKKQKRKQEPTKPN